LVLAGRLPGSGALTLQHWRAVVFRKESQN